MTSVVEARSLASITTLASDPPLYPYNPTHSPHGSLALYIVRVPGSKDVFLTPLKPRDKVVSAQDVQSSLYFLHIDEDDDDEDTLMPLAPDYHSLRSVSAATQPGRETAYIARKPLPTPPTSPVETPEEPLRVRKAQLTINVPKRKPVINRPSDNHGGLDLPQIPPRPSYRTTASFDSSTYSLRGPESPRPLSQFSRGPDSPRPMSYLSTSSYPWDFTDAASDNLQSPKPPPKVSLTLIRRDPATGAQWNVAKIHDAPVQEVSSESIMDGRPPRAKTAGAPLSIDVCNPGYSKFLNSELSSASSRDSTKAYSVGSGSYSDGIFHRRLWMDGSRFADHSYTHRKHLTLDRHIKHHRSSLNLDSMDYPSSSKPVVDRRSKGYTFRSPWGGKCEFVTGVSGRALKCRHRNEAAEGQVSDISELRFNLPATGASGGTIGAPEQPPKRSSRLMRPHLRSYSSFDFPYQGEETFEGLTNYFDERGNINLSLGRERAGGGFQGKQAKLGKLIIEEMGLKMLDLTVATNMALWWRAYDRT